jgi:amino acid permease
MFLNDISTGTGLFLGMGEALNKGGPLGLVLGYLVM